MNKVNSILNKELPHINWVNAFDDALAMLTMAEPGEVISIVGPSGVGKSSLISSLTKAMFLNGNEVSGTMNYICIVAGNFGTNGSFSSKSFLLQMLDALEHPVFSISGEVLPTKASDYSFTRSTEHTLKLALEKALTYRGIKYIFVDEAQHIKYTVNSKASAAGALDSWKCIAQTVGVVLVIVGTYPLLDTMKDSPHFLRRKHQVHFPRYKQEEQDIAAFFLILRTYEKMLGGKVIDGLLVDNGQLLFEQCLGCIGILKNILQGALALADFNESEITIDLLKSRFHSEYELSHMLEEMTAGEKLLSPSLSVEDKTDLNIDKSDSTSKRKKARSKPFQANPRRRSKGNRNGERK